MDWLTSGPGVWVLLAFAVYGTLSLIFDAARLIGRSRRTSTPVFGMVVLVHNQEQYIEGFLRTLADKTASAGTSLAFTPVLVVDLASTDQTGLIIERIAKQHPHIRLVRLPEGRSVSAQEAALFLCQSAVAVVIDLRGHVDAWAILNQLDRLWL